MTDPNESAPVSTVGSPGEFEALLWRTGELLRTGEFATADATIHKALDLRPRDAKARSLLGLVHFKSGRQQEARDTYLALASEFPGDASIQLNLGLVELKLGALDAAVAALEQSVRLDTTNERARQYLELARRVRAQAHGTVADLERPEATPGLAGGLGIRTPVPGTGILGGGRAALEPRFEPPQPVTAFAASRLVLPPASAGAFSLAPGGALAIQVHGEIYTRTDGLVSSVSGVTFEPARRRQRGLTVEHSFGDGPSAMFLARGDGQLIAVPRGGHFHALSLDQDVLYVREDLLYAFEPALNWENGRAPGGEPTLVQFRGTGAVALQVPRDPFCVKLDGAATLYADAGALVGWIGRVVPRALPAEPGARRFLECSGEGVLVFEAPPG
jgi:uncharacterized protein (AIM24 family)